MGVFAIPSNLYMGTGHCWRSGLYREIFSPVPCLVTLPWPPARASFLSFPSPIPILLRGFLRGMHVVFCYSDPELTWGNIQIYVSALRPNSVWPGSQGWSPFPGTVVPSGQCSLGLVPRYREGTLVGTYGQIIFILLATCGAFCGELLRVRRDCRNYVGFYNICSYIQ
jgi:hypothetical protein